MLNNSINYDGLIGTVMKSDPSTRECWVFVPKLMPGLPEGDYRQDSVSTVGSGSPIDEKELSVDPTVVRSNALLCRAWDMDAPLPAAGSHVWVRVLDGNIRLRFWEKCNVGGDFKAIEGEGSPKVMTLSVGGRKADVMQGDSVSIVLPGTLSSAVDAASSSKTVTVSYSSGYATEDRLRSALDTIDYLFGYAKKTMYQSIYSSKPSDAASLPAWESIAASASAAISSASDMPSAISASDEASYRISCLSSLASARDSLTAYYASYLSQSGASIPSGARYADSAAVSSAFSSYASALAEAAYPSIPDLASKFLSNLSASCEVTEWLAYSEEAVSLPLFSALEKKNISPSGSSDPNLVCLGYYGNPSFLGDKCSAATSSSSVWAAYMGVSEFAAASVSGTLATSLSAIVRNDLSESLTAYVYSYPASDASSKTKAADAAIDPSGYCGITSAYIVAASSTLRYGICVSDSASSAYMAIPTMG